MIHELTMETHFKLFFFAYLFFDLDDSKRFAFLNQQ